MRHSTSRMAQPEQSYGGRNKNVIIRRQENHLGQGCGWGTTGCKEHSPGHQEASASGRLRWKPMPLSWVQMGPGVYAVPPSCSTEKHKVFLSLGWKQRKLRATEVTSLAQITLKRQFSRARCHPAQTGQPSLTRPTAAS